MGTSSCSFNLFFSHEESFLVVGCTTIYPIYPNFLMSHNMWIQNGGISRLLQEYRDLANVNFRFMEKQQPRSYVSSRVTGLWDYPMNEILCGDCLFPQWKPELIDTIVNCLTPQNIRVHVVAKAYENIANETERWYSTKYKKERISTRIIDMWEDAGYNSEFHLPAKNEFIPSRLDLKPRDDNVIGYYFIYIRVRVCVCVCMQARARAYASCYFFEEFFLLCSTFDVSLRKKSLRCSTTPSLEHFVHIYSQSMFIDIL